MRNSFMRTTHASAVSAGIAHTIQAAIDDSIRETTESWVQFCVKAADEAYATIMEHPPKIISKSKADPLMLGLLRMGDVMSHEDHAKYGAEITHNADDYAAGKRHSKRMDDSDVKVAANAAAAMAFRCCMPQLTGRRRAQAYFACVAAGLQRGYFPGPEAKAMLHSAQLALNAFPRRQPKPRSARRNEQNEPCPPHPPPRQPLCPQCA